MSFNIGTRVETEKGSGVVEFCGKTEFADGVWIGINLDGPNGKNDGSVRGVRYFECEPNHGIFMKASQVRIEGRGKSGMRIPTTIRKDMKSKNSPYSSPRITPSSSTEKLKNVGKTQLTKIYSKEDIVSKFNPKSSKTVEEFQSAETTQKFGVSVTKYPSGKKLDIEVNDLNDSENLPVSENVKSIVKKMEESPLLAPVVLPSGMDECNELQWLRIQHKDLTEKIESLRFRRKEDHIKLIEFERNRIQLDTLLQFKAKILEEHTNLQRKLQEKEKELREALRSKGNENDDLKEIEERLELITIEKEMAEEKADILQAEVEAEKQRAETLEIELKLLQTEMEQAGDNLLTGNSVQMKQLEQQNEKLREALIRMRDVTGQMVVDKQEISQENEKLKNELASLTKLCEKINKDATVYENTITELRERVDLAMGSEKMIETLTDKNLEMEEKIRTLEETIADFEAIRVMDEEILETQKDAEKELREELDQAFGKINELLFQIKTCNAQAEDYEKMILMFRKKVSDLNEEIQERYDEHLRVLERLKFLEEGNTTSEMPSAGFVAARTFSEIVDAEIKSLEFRFALQHIEYLKAFMPENFTKPGGDDDVIILNVLFPRLYEKAVVLAKLINDKYPPVPGGLRREHVTKTHKAEQWALCAKFNYLLNSFESVVRKFGSAIQSCSVERLSRLAQLQLEIQIQERMIDQYIDLLKTSCLDENTPSANLEKGVLYFQNIFSVHMSGETYDVKQSFSDIITQFLSGMSWMKINTQRFLYFLLPGNEKSEMHFFAISIMTLITECEQLIIRCRNRIPAENEMITNQLIDDRLLNTINTLGKVANILDCICATASLQLCGHTDAEGLESDRIEEMLQSAVDKINGHAHSLTAQELIKSYIVTLKSEFEKLAVDFDSGNLEVEGSNKKPFPPLLERAHIRKQDVMEVEGLRWQIEKKENDISDLKKALRTRADEISRYRLRLEMADKKTGASGKADASQLSVLKSRCDQLQNELTKRRIEYEETMDTIQRDLEACEKENFELKERAKSMSRKALLMNLSSTLHSSISSSPNSFILGNNSFANVAEVNFLENALAENQNALRQANEKIRYLKVQGMLQLLSCTGLLNISNEINGPLTLDAAQGSYKDELDKLTREAECVIAEARKYQVPYIIDFNKKKKTQLIEEHQYYLDVQNVNYKINDLKLRINRFWSKHNPGKPLPTLFNNIRSVAVKKAKDFETDNVGVHSNAYRNAYSTLFGSLEMERRKFESNRVFC